MYLLNEYVVELIRLYLIVITCSPSKIKFKIITHLYIQNIFN